MDNNDYTIPEPKAKEMLETEKLSNYLISLFYKSDCKYTCTRPKINRLLTIYKLSSINFDNDCFRYYFSANSTYMAITGFIPMIDRDVYFNPQKGDNKEFYNDEFDNSIPIPLKYQINENDITEEKKELLENIFRNFASYSINNLAEMLNELQLSIPFEQKTDDNGFIFTHLDYEQFTNYLNSDNSAIAYSKNNVFAFIKNIVNEASLNRDDHTLKLKKD